jgi:hypothetical protein
MVVKGDQWGWSCCDRVIGTIDVRSKLRAVYDERLGGLRLCETVDSGNISRYF